MNFEKSFFNRGVSDREQSGKVAVSHPVADLINLQVGAGQQFLGIAQPQVVQVADKGAAAPAGELGAQVLLVQAYLVGHGL